jgi:RHS repeat-associated protein
MSLTAWAHISRAVLLRTLLSFLLVTSSLAPFAPRAATAAATPSWTPARVSTATQTAPSREGELLVRFREGVAEAGKSAAVSTRGGRVRGRLRGESGVEKVEAQPGVNLRALAESLRVDPSVEFAEPNFIIARTQTLPNDERFAEQWALKNTGQGGGQMGADIAAAGAWQRVTGTTATVVAVLDSGVDFTHPDLHNNQWTNRAERINGKDDDRDGFVDDLHGWDWVADSNVVKDEQGHGTAVAGIIAAEGNNRVGVVGVMWGASLMSLRVLDNTGTGDVAAAVEAIDYAAAHGAQVINLSWGTEGESLALKDAVERAGRAGVLVVCSAGNGGRDLENDPYYPASFGLPNLLAVASTDGFDQLMTWSNHSATHVAVAAPGTDILTTKMGGGYTTVTGTSASAPLVAGIAGLIKTERPWLTAAAVRAAIVDGARRVSALEGQVSAGGVASAAGALEASEAGPYSPPHGHGNNQGGNGRQTPPPVPPGRGRGGRGQNGSFDVAPTDTTGGAPGPNLPNLDQIRRGASDTPLSSAPIQSNLICADCQNGGGGGGAGGSDPYFAKARTQPINRTGEPDVTLGSRNFNWALPIFNLPGRAGLDAGMTLFYNSLVWTKQDGAIEFNADHGNPAPGFRLGLPRLQPRHYNSQTGIWAYMFLTPAGGRVELRQVGTSNIYEAIDGSYIQLDAAASVVRTTDGTQYVFGMYPDAYNEYRCLQVKDRNGNYITADYDLQGHIQTLRDTLNRVVTFTYDANANLTSVKQTWNGAEHLYAEFFYGSQTLQPNFPGLTIYGVNNDFNATVLTRVKLSDQSYYDFKYTSYGQVWKIEHHAADTHLLAQTSYNLPGSPLLADSAQTDCPRFTERREWAQSWNGDTDGQPPAAEEAVTGYNVDPNGAWATVTLPDSTPGDASDNVVEKEYYETTGWRAGLTIRTENYMAGAPSVLKKWTTTAWTQDNESLPYQKNPRPTDINIYDEAGNRRRTTIDYNAYSLPHIVIEYAADGTTALRRTHLDYIWDAPFINRRIIGLLYQREIYDTNYNLHSKVRYSYDWGGEHMQDTPAQPTQHDSVNYGASFIYGRGNLCLVERLDVTDPNNANNTHVEFKTGYNKTGSVTFTRDPLWHHTWFSYTDSFSDNTNRNTFAYPTAVTDADGFSATTKYNYDTGAMTYAQDPKGAAQALQYDAAGRLEQVTNQVNGAYTRFVYPSSMTYVGTLTKVDVGYPEVAAWKHFDGAGRVRAVSADLPGSVGGYTGQYITYDAAGGAVKQSNPTEMNGSWTPAGDDAAAGWVWTLQAYDWKGRPTVTTYPAVGSPAVSSTSELSYGGCGCAGGEVLTVRDERGRRRKLYKDELGRLKKVEELNWNESVYAATTYAYNVRDQITEINQAGQLRSFQYDGHGRLWKRTTPEQGQTTYLYNTDDTLQSVTDARGASSSFVHNSRHLVTNINYGVPAGVAATPNVSFTYDAAGNRTRMTDGLGWVDYNYDTLSRLTWEERNFMNVGAYRLTYDYNLAGQLKSIINQWGSQVGYTRDVAGRVTNVTGSGQISASSYAQNISYRAFGGLKGMTYGNSRQLSVTYDNRLRVKTWNIPTVMGWDYSYSNFGENTGRVTYAQNLSDPTLDRSYDYDQVGRMVAAYTGSEARTHTATGVPGGPQDGPYAQANTYDQWGNITQRQGWGGAASSYTASYTNNKRNGFSYDAAGNLTNDLGQTFTYDATGQQATAAYGGYSLQQAYDGDTLRAKKTENGTATYYLRSSVLGGQVVAEIKSAGGSWSWSRGYVYDGGGSLLAIQSDGLVRWPMQDPVTKSQRITDTIGGIAAAVDVDPWGGETGRSWNAGLQPRKYTTYERDGNGTDEAMMRRYNRWHSRFDQPDPYNGSYDFSNPQGLNRYAYTHDDPVNFTDPLGLDEHEPICDSDGNCYPWEPPMTTTYGSIIESLVDLYDSGNLIQSEGRGRPLFSTNNGGESFAMIWQVNLPRPNKTVAQQQANFETCARNAIRNWRRTEYRAVAKIAGGTIGFTASTITGARGLSSIFAITSAAVKITSYNTGYRVLQLGTAGSLASSLVSGVAVSDGFTQSFSNRADVKRALNDCKAQSPQANHGTANIYITTW